MCAREHAAQLELRTGDERELRALHAWLREDDELRGRVRQRTAPARDGEMGGVVDALLVACGTGGTAALAQCLTTWLKQRHTDVTITLTEPEREISVEVHRTRHPDEVLREIRRLTGADEP